MRTSSYTSLLTWLTFCTLWVGGVGVSGYVSITHDDHWQWNPALSSRIVAWEDHRNSTWDIYGYDLSTGEELEIITGPGNQTTPSVYESMVVWTDDRKGNEDIYFAGPGTINPVCITDNEYIQMNPVLSATIIIWQDNRQGTWDIYGYDLSTGEELEIITGPGNQTTPSVYENMVVWTDDRQGNEDIYGYDLFTGEEFQITSDEQVQRNPSIFGNIVVWEDYRNGNADIYAFILGEATEFPICIDAHEQIDPIISRYFVAWIDDRHRNSDIYGFMFNSPATFRVSRDPLLGFSHTRYDLAGWESMLLWVTGYRTHSTLSGYIIQEPFSSLSQWMFAGVVVMGMILILLFFRRLYHHTMFWIGAGIFCAMSATFFEEYVTDSGTVLLLAGSPLFSLLTVFYTPGKYSIIMPACSVGMTAGVIDSLRVPWESGMTGMGIFVILLYLSTGIGWTYLLEKKQIIQSKNRKKKIEPRFCPHCGKKMKAGWNVCPYCKSDLDFTRVYDDTGE